MSYALVQPNEKLLEMAYTLVQPDKKLFNAPQSCIARWLGRLII